MKAILTTFFLFLLITLVFTNCKKVEFKVDNVPECFKEMVKRNTIPSLTKINEFKIDNQLFYEVLYDNCNDCMIELYNEDCSYFCAPSGGFGGGGDGKCPTWSGIPERTLVWERE